LSDYDTWSAKEHADKWLLFPKNIGPKLCIDETAMSNGELYTIISNPDAHGRKGTLVAMVEGVKSDDIIDVINRIPEQHRRLVKEVTLDMSNGMNRIVTRCFPCAIKVIDRFHVQKEACEAVQELRIRHRWDAIQEETDLREDAKWLGKEYHPFIFPNGDTKKQLLARSRYLLFKSPDKWSKSQKERAAILFAQYPDLKEAYSLSHSLRMIFSKRLKKDEARLMLARWYDKVDNSGFTSFNTIAGTIYEHYDEILNYFVNRSTSAFAESFNAKIKAFRAQLRGVTDLKFFLYRLTKLFA
jgi:transposase